MSKTIIVSENKIEIQDIDDNNDLVEIAIYNSIIRDFKIEHTLIKTLQCHNSRICEQYSRDMIIDKQEGSKGCS